MDLCDPWDPLNIHQYSISTKQHIKMRDVTWIQTNDTRGPSSEQQKVENSFGDCPCAFSPPIIFTPLRHGWGLVPKRGELVTKRRALVPKRLQFHGGLTFVHVIGILTKLFLYQMQRFFSKNNPTKQSSALSLPFARWQFRIHWNPKNTSLLNTNYMLSLPPTI